MEYILVGSIHQVSRWSIGVINLWAACFCVISNFRKGKENKSLLFASPELVGLGL